MAEILRKQSLLHGTSKGANAHYSHEYDGNLGDLQGSAADLQTQCAESRSKEKPL